MLVPECQLFVDVINELQYYRIILYLLKSASSITPQPS